MTDMILDVDAPTVNDLLLCLPDDSDWNVLEDALQMPDIKDKYAKELDKFIKKPTRIELFEIKSRPITSTLDGEKARSDDINKSYSITVVPGVLAVRVDVGIRMAANWYGKVVVTPTIFGKGVGSSEAQVSRAQSFIEIHPSALLVKADLKIGIYGDKMCFGIEGRACYWAFGWKCQSFDKQGLFCLK